MAAGDEFFELPDDDEWWVATWAKQLTHRKVFWHGGVFAWFDVAFRIVGNARGHALFLYHCGTNLVPFAMLDLGGPEWRDLSFEEQARDVIMAIKRRQGNGGPGNGKWQGDLDTLTLYPQLCEFLTADEYEGGGKRSRGTLTLMSIDRSWRAVLNDKDTNESLWAAADTLAGLLEAIELELCADEPNWRSKPGPRGQKK